MTSTLPCDVATPNILARRIPLVAGLHTRFVRGVASAHQTQSRAHEDDVLVLRTRAGV